MNASVAARGVSSPLFAVLLLGPVLTVLGLGQAISSGALHAVPAATYLGAALLFWSPLPFSVPAVLLESHRDAALSELRGPVGWVLRAVLLMPYLVVSPRSAVRAQAAASLVGFGAAVVLAWPVVGPTVTGLVTGALNLLG